MGVARRRARRCLGCGCSRAPGHQGGSNLPVPARDRDEEPGWLRPSIADRRNCPQVSHAVGGPAALTSGRRLRRPGGEKPGSPQPVSDEQQYSNDVLITTLGIADAKLTNANHAGPGHASPGHPTYAGPEHAHLNGGGPDPARRRVAGQECGPWSSACPLR